MPLVPTELRGKSKRRATFLRCFVGPLSQLEDLRGESCSAVPTNMFLWAADSKTLLPFHKVSEKCKHLFFTSEARMLQCAADQLPSLTAQDTKTANNKKPNGLPETC